MKYLKNIKISLLLTSSILLFLYVIVFSQSDVFNPYPPKSISVGPANQPYEAQILFSSEKELQRDNLLIQVGRNLARIIELINLTQEEIKKFSFSPSSDPNLYYLRFQPPTQKNAGSYDINFTLGNRIMTLRNYVIYEKGINIRRSINRGLNWLRRSQSIQDGSWRSNVGITSLAALAFLNNGIDENDPTVSTAIQYILRNVTPEGKICSPGVDEQYYIYETPMAIMALKATGNGEYNQVIERARDWLVRQQRQDGSWPYGDLSHTQWVLMGLEVAGGIPKDSEMWQRCIRYLDTCQTQDGGFGYRPNESAYGSMTGAGIWSLILCGVSPQDNRIQRALRWIGDHYNWDENPGKGTWALYYYYLTLSKALTMSGVDKIIDKAELPHNWYLELAEKLIQSQQEDPQDPNKAFWINRDGGTSCEGWPELATAYAILALEMKASRTQLTKVIFMSHNPNLDIHLYDWKKKKIEKQLSNCRLFNGKDNSKVLFLYNPVSGQYQIELEGIQQGEYNFTVEGKSGNRQAILINYPQRGYRGKIKQGNILRLPVNISSLVGSLTLTMGSLLRQAEIGLVPLRWPVISTQTIKLPVFVDSMEDVQKVSLEINYNPSIFTPISVDGGKIFEKGKISWEAPQKIKNNKEKIIINGEIPHKWKTKLYEGDLFTINFKVLRRYLFIPGKILWGERIISLEKVNMSNFNGENIPCVIPKGKGKVLIFSLLLIYIILFLLLILIYLPLKLLFPRWKINNLRKKIKKLENLKVQRTKKMEYLSKLESQKDSLGVEIYQETYSKYEKDLQNLVKSINKSLAKLENIKQKNKEKQNSLESLVDKLRSQIKDLQTMYENKSIAEKDYEQKKNKLEEDIKKKEKENIFIKKLLSYLESIEELKNKENK